MSKLQHAALLLSLSLSAMALPVMAEPWFDRYDHNHDGKWTYDDFSRAHREYVKKHHEEKRMSERALKEQWNKLDKDHHGWVREEQVRSFHHWD